MKPSHSDIDLFSDATLLDPYPAYRELRDQAAGVFLTRCEAWFIGRYQDVKNALSDWQSFSSDKGIGLNPTINAAWNEALICQDPPVHTERRKLMTAVLSPAALKPISGTIDARAAALVDRVAACESFDGVAEFAHDLPIGIVMELIGWPEEVRGDLLAIAEGSWNGAGPSGARTDAGLVTLQAMMALIADIYDHDRVVPGGFAAQLIDAAHHGEITRETAIGMLAGYIVAAFETTISAMASGLWLFAENPNEWTKLRADPSRAARAANEIVRVESPLQNFARVTTCDVSLSDGSVIPCGERVIVSYASANRDERAFAEPDRFIIDRKEAANMGFGHGPHLCAGQGLARMELNAVFGALARKVERLELAGTPTRIINNIARGFRHLPLRAIPVTGG